jgi:hypothetical protein
VICQTFGIFEGFAVFDFVSVFTFAIRGYSASRIIYLCSTFYIFVRTRRGMGRFGISSRGENERNTGDVSDSKRKTPLLPPRSFVYRPGLSCFRCGDALPQRGSYHTIA